MSDFELPTNIRQIGGVDEHLRIYVEDYAVTYLKKFAESGGESDRIAFLVGKYMVIDNQSFLFICGAIQGKFASYDEGKETFSDESFEYAASMMDKYFEGYEVVGWMQSQPGYGSKLNPVSADYHMNSFIKPYHVLLVIDPTEKLESFYAWDKTMVGMNEVQGYFVFYDRNRGMQEYMLDNKLTNVRAFSRGTVRSDETTKTETPQSVRASVRKTGERGTKVAGRTAEAVKAEAPEYKRLVNMLVGLSAALFVICFIMGAGLLQSDGRIGQVERDLSALNGSYGYVLGQISQLSAQLQNQSQTQPVFAPGDNQLQSADGVNTYTQEPDAAITGQQTGQDQDLQSARRETPTPAPAATPSPEPTATPPATPAQTQRSIELPVATQPLSQSNIAVPTPKTQSAQEGSANAGTATSSLWAPPYNEEEFDEYVVQRGDTLSGICVSYYGSTELIEKIMEVNHISQPDMIYFGKVLLMPKVQTAGN